MKKTIKMIVLSVFFLLAILPCVMNLSLYNKSQALQPHLLITGSVKYLEIAPINYHLEKVQGYEVTTEYNKDTEIFTIHATGNKMNSPFVVAEWNNITSTSPITTHWTIEDYSKTDILFNNQKNLSITIFQLTIGVGLILGICTLIKKEIANYTKVKDTCYLMEYIEIHMVSLLIKVILGLVMLFVTIFLLILFVQYTPYLDTMLFTRESIGNWDTYKIAFSQNLQELKIGIKSSIQFTQEYATLIGTMQLLTLTQVIAMIGLWWREMRIN